MKRLIFCLLFLPCGLHAQECKPAALVVPLTGNNIKAFIQTNGSLYRSSGYPGLTAPVGSDIGTIFFEGFWLVGLDSSGDIPSIVMTYDGFNHRFFPGILDTNGHLDSANCINYNKFWQITKGELLAALADFNDDGIVENPPASLKTWPALGNPFFEAENGFALPSEKAMAPFFDRDGDGLYNPTQGDLPQPEATLPEVVLPANLYWFVFNTDDILTTGKFPVEVQFTAWSFNCVNNTLLHNTIFTSRKIINYSNTSVNSTRFGLFVDFDLGCYLDDYVGCIPPYNSVYSYNADNFDDPKCAPNPGFPAFPSYLFNPPVQSVTFLNHSLDGYMIYLNPGIGSVPPGMFDPDLPSEYYNYLTSRWRDGHPLTYGGTGYDPTGTNTDTTLFAFPGDPNNSDEWSMLAESFDTALDVRTLASSHIGTFHPGDAVRFDVAYSWHRGSSLSNLENVSLMKQRLPVLIDLYNQHFAGSCATVSNMDNPDELLAIDIYPNPSGGVVHLRFPQQQMEELALFDVSGKLVLFDTKEVFDELEVDLRRFPAGIYFLHATFGQRTVREMIVLTN